MSPREKTGHALELSIVIPVFNEELSLPTLLEQVHNALLPMRRSYEVIVVDDGSTDGSYALLARMTRVDPSLTVIRFRRNFGQTPALQAGIDSALGRIIVTMDSDLQNDPADIPRLVDKLEEGFDLVVGWRANRKDTFLNRRLPSMIANRMIGQITKVRLHDYGCTLKAMHSELAKQFRLYGEMHRFIPAVATFIGAKITELQVNHRARQHGNSKYGIGRTLRVILDLMTVGFIQNYLTRPMQVFGLWGLLSGTTGVGISLWLTIEKIAFHKNLADRPLLLLGVLLIVVGVQLVSLGLMADIVARTYHEAQDRRPYFVRNVIEGRRNATVPALDNTGSETVDPQQLS
jgi:glycosyltransferase involved in cell wall biosynthesis